MGNKSKNPFNSPIRITIKNFMYSHKFIASIINWIPTIIVLTFVYFITFPMLDKLQYICSKVIPF